MDPGLDMKELLKADRGLSLLEAIIALGIVSLTIVVLLQVLPVATAGTSRARAGVNLVNVANSQLENIKQLPYQTSYGSLPSLSPQFSAAVTVTVPITYRYPSPSLPQTTDTVQLVTVTVTGPYGARSLEGYKARR